MVAIGCSKISLSFGEKTVLDNVSFSLEEGDKLGVVGVNGAGKTTLIKILTGEQSSDSGEVFVSQKATVGYLDQYATLDSDNTVYEEMLSSFDTLLKMEEELESLSLDLRAGIGNVADTTDKYTRLSDRYRELGGYEFRSRTTAMLKKMGFSENMHSLPVKSLSGGQKTSLALVGLLLQSPSILILDEPTNHLDIESLRWLEGYLAGQNTTLIVISHDRYFLDKVTTHTLDIENTHATLYKGNYSVFAEKKEKDREIYRRHWENQQKEIARQEAFIEQQRRWNREKNIIAAESRLKALERMEKLDAPENLPTGISFAFGEAIRSCNDVLKVEELSKAFDEKRLFSNLSFEVKRQDRFFVLGRNGCGKSTLLKILAEKLFADRGEFTFGTNVKLGYYDQEYQGLDPNNTVLDELWNEYSEKSMTEIRSALALFRFTRDDVFKKVEVLSGGEKARLTLAKLMLSKVNLLLLDEPTNHLDIASRETLEDAVASFQGTVIAVSHDRYFISKLATRILHIDGNSSRVFEGNYEYYLDRLEPTSAVSTTASDSSARDSYRQEKEKKARERKRERDLAKTEAEIEETEAEISELVEKMNGELARDYTALMEAEEKRKTLEEHLEKLYARLEELE
ncbi:MAG: ABC-F family ATP-binding cassette domain-containing protein [Clostridia bacterium]|nr:ABC-F family ATP-binding cassette domain-containing protein [Clostridia bacterium]